MSETVFVYGTLRKGECRFGIDTFERVIHEEAYLRGYKLLDLGAFPGIVPGEEDDVVVGEIHHYSTLDRLDDIEGYNESNPEASFYLRTEVDVEAAPEGDSEGGTVRATTYLLNEYREVWGEKVIANGDWRKRGESCSVSS